MLDEKQILPLNYLSYGGVFTGDHQGMRYRLARGGEKPDFFLAAWVWPEPFCFDVTDEEKKEGKHFPFTEEGRLEAIRWIQEQYENRRSEWGKAEKI